MKSKRYCPVYFLPAHLIPAGFSYPESWRQFASSGKTNVGELNYDWRVLDEDEVRGFVDYARRIVPDRALVPFMRRNGEDGVVCFDAEGSAAEPRVWSFNYCGEVGYNRSSLTFSEWSARFPSDQDEDGD